MPWPLNDSCSFQSILDWLPPDLRPTLEREWQALGIDTRRMLPGYPVAVWWRAVEATTALLEGSRRERLRDLGRGLAEHYARSVMGRALAPFARLIGTRRTLMRSAVFRSANNFVETVVEHDVPGELRLRVNDVSPISDMFAGSLEGLVTFTGGRDPQVEYIEGTTETVYTVRWS